MKRFYVAASFCYRKYDKEFGWEYFPSIDHDLIVYACDKKRAFNKIWKWAKANGAYNKHIFFHDNYQSFLYDKIGPAKIIR